MKSKISKYVLFSAISIVLLFTSCATSGTILVTDNPGKKVGEASYEVILGIFRPMHVDASIRRAAHNGGITKIATVDYVVERNAFKTRYITIVTGE